MKRRNADCGKLRRPIKRNKITEGMYGSTTVLYMKFLVLWAIVITADFMFMFRFEFLWPFWLLLRSVHDSFKYKGLAFSVLFVCIAITSDLVCLFFIPVHWLLFAASTYVWVQYVWHTDKGICLPTIILWMLFVYLEAGIRWKDSRHMPHLDLCRPFAAHCIGYPVVTLGFGFKSYIGYRMRQRKQREVSKENDFYIQLLQQALPQEETLTAATPTATIEGTTPTVTVASTLTTPTSTPLLLSSPSPPSIITTATTIHNAQNSQNNNVAMLANGNVLSTAATTSLPTTPNGIGIMNSSVIQNHHSHTLQHHYQQQQPLHQNHQQQLQQHQTQAQHLQTHPQNHINSIEVNGTSGNSNCSSSNNNSNSISTITSDGITTSSTIMPTTTITSLNSSLNDDKDFAEISSNGVGGHIGGATANGHIGGSINTKTQRRNADKENKNRNGSSSSSSANETDSKRSNNYMKNNNNNNNTNHLHVESNSNSNNNSNNNNSLYSNKDKSDPEHTVTTQNFKEKHEDQRDTTNSTRSNSNSSRKSNIQANSATTNSKINENLLQGDTEPIVTVEPVERTKGRRNRSKKDNIASKDNHHHSNISNNNNNYSSNSNSNSNNSTTQSNNNSNSNNSNHQLHHNNSHNQQTNNINSKEIAFTASINSDASSVSSATSSSSSSTTSSSASTAASTISNIASKVVSKICESCLKFEADVKKYRSELSHMKQIENELRQKLESNLTTKSCLQAKHKECEELEKRVLEITNLRHADYKAAERRLGEERRQKQSLEAQLNNEKKARKLAEEKAARPECSAQCKQRKQQMEDENKQLRRDLKTTDEAKLLAEQHGRKWEQELRNIEAEMRNRDSNQQGTEMLMNALAAIQDKNCTLEKNLSAETRVKLDLFSALGDAKRQLEISESRRRAKEEEVLDLKAKIAQLLAVMPTDTLCLPACNSTGAGVMLRMNDTPPLQPGPVPVCNPGSPMLTTLTVQATSPSIPSNRIVVPTSAPDYVQQAPTEYGNQPHQQHQSHQQQHLHQQQIHQQQLQHQMQQHQQQQQQQQQQQCSGMVPVSVANAVLTVSGNSPGAGASNLDPNATVYTPKAIPNGQGGVVVVGGINGDA